MAIAIGQEHRSPAQRLAEDYTQLTQTYRLRLAQCLSNVQQAHQDVCARRTALTTGPPELRTWPMVQEIQACEQQMIRLETLRLQISKALATLE